MAGYTEAAAAVRRAREARDAARDELYLLQLRGVALSRAQARAARGDGRRDPAIDAALRSLRAQLEAVNARNQAIAAQLDALDPVEGEVARLTQRIEAAPAVSAALTQEIARLAGALDAASPNQREPMQDSVRTAQSQRAALADAISRDRESLAKGSALLKNAIALRGEARAVAARATKLRRDIESTEERGRDVNLGAISEQNKGSINEAKDVKGRRDADLRAAIDGLYTDQTPADLIASWDDSLPITLLPLRIETRWKPDLPRGGG